MRRSLGTLYEWDSFHFHLLPFFLGGLAQPLELAGKWKLEAAVSWDRHIVCTCLDVIYRQLTIDLHIRNSKLIITQSDCLFFFSSFFFVSSSARD
jgi:hypothetical protein